MYSNGAREKRLHRLRYVPQQHPLQIYSKPTCHKFIYRVLDATSPTTSISSSASTLSLEPYSHTHPANPPAATPLCPLHLSFPQLALKLRDLPLSVLSRFPSHLPLTFLRNQLPFQFLYLRFSFPLL